MVDGSCAIKKCALSCGTSIVETIWPTVLISQGEYSKLQEKFPSGLKPRSFPIHVLNDSLKNLGQRAGVIGAWDRSGGVLLMGYELYRQLANRKPRRRKQKGPECIDIEEEDRNKNILNGKKTLTEKTIHISILPFLWTRAEPKRGKCFLKH